MSGSHKIRRRARAGLIWLTHGKTCNYCGLTVKAKRDMTVDHIIPLSAGGSNEEENLQLLCGPCNQHKNKLEQKAANEMVRIAKATYLRNGIVAPL